MYFRMIPGWFEFYDIYDEAVKKAPDTPSTFVEIGCWLGKSTCYLGETIKESKKPITVYAVDTWAGSNEQAHQEYIQSIGGPEVLYQKFLHNLKCADIENIVKPLRKTSKKASLKFEDDSLEMVFIDASHDYLDVREDIDLWLPKVKKGGIIGGDDIEWDDVRKAVKEMIPNYTTRGSSWITVK